MLVFVIYVLSRIIVEGSICAVMDGRQCPRSRVHKFVYGALMQIIWQGYPAWPEENQLDVFHMDNTQKAIKALPLSMRVEEFEIVLQDV